MRRSIATVSLSGTLEQKMAAAAEAGFDGIEIFESDLIASARRPEDIRRAAADLGLSLDLYQPFRDAEAVPTEVFADNLRRARAKFSLMNSLGIDTILICSNVATATIDDDALAAEQLHDLAVAAEDYGCRIAYEALAWGRYVNDFEHGCRIVALAGHPGLGTCLDSFHILSRTSNISAIASLAADSLFFVQLADAPKLSLDVLSWSRHHRVFPGEGQFDLPTFVAAVVQTGYSGTLSLEVFNDVFRQTDPERTAVDAMRSLLWLEDQAAQVRPATAEARSPILSGLPPVAQPLDFAFAEVRSVHPEPLTRLLDQLGFDRVGRHRTKPVELWAQGDARVIVNESADSESATRLSAVGLDVADAEAAADRARALRAPEVARSRQCDEELIVVVRAPDGTEILFCQSRADGEAGWRDEFSREASSLGVRSPGITRIDHINLEQPWQYFDEAVLFYRSAASLTPLAPVDVPGPAGLVRSQVMRTDDGRVRIVLNLAPAGVVDDTSFPRHVAFATEDVVSIARRAMESGMEPLAIPENYYADLDARLGLDHDFLALLRELNLLYERDEQGEFLHFYTRAVGGIFFEVVERRGKYDGYGSTNASVRLSAQQRPRTEASARK